MSTASKSGRDDAGPARQRFLLTFFAEKKVRRNENQIFYFHYRSQSAESGGPAVGFVSLEVKVCTTLLNQR
jgi:hypothetical protein